MKDIIVVALLVLAFAWLVTVHVTIVFGLAKKLPRWRAPVAFFVPVLAPYWAFREHMRVRAGLWVGGVVVYLVALLMSL
ncbi:MAG: hypothetical protein U0270_14535 [Labilithrix sp.]